MMATRATRGEIHRHQRNRRRKTDKHFSGIAFLTSAMCLIVGVGFCVYSLGFLITNIF